MSDKELLYLFVDALHPRTRSDVLAKGPTTLQQAMEYAAFYEESCSDLKQSFNTVNLARKINYAKTQYPKKVRFRSSSGERSSFGFKGNNGNNNRHTKKNFTNFKKMIKNPKDEKVQCYNCNN